jgi:hypothetical protein
MQQKINVIVQKREVMVSAGMAKRGFKGETGDTGPQGDQGVQGPQGDQGPQGHIATATKRHHYTQRREDLPHYQSRYHRG